jgi:hypothetical protein
VIDAANEQWSYGSRSGGKGTIGIVPISLYNQQPECPWCNLPTLANEIPTGQVWFNGTGDFLLTNGKGQRLGYVGNELVNEIPGADANIIDGGLDIPMEPYYTIPFSDSYTILLTGESATDSEPASISQYGPGYATSIDDIPMTANTNDQITIASDGTRINYLSNEAKEVTMEVIVEETDTDQDWHFQVQGTDIGSGQMVTATADLDQDKLIIDNSRASGGEYDIQIVRFNATGVQTFTDTAITIAAGDSHAIDYGSWDDSTNTVPLEIDEQSDGSVDQTVTLGKQEVASIQVQSTAEQGSLPADGQSTTIITATLLDADDNPIVNETATFTTTLGTLNSLSTPTDDAGIATTTLTAGTTPGTATITVTAGGRQRSIDVVFVESEQQVYLPLVVR